MRSARPTAVNLAWGVDRVAAVAAATGDLAAVEAAARAVLDEDVAANRAIGERGADLLAELCVPRSGAASRASASTPTATPGRWPASTVGTALGVVRAVHARGASPVSTPTRPAPSCRARA